MVSPIDTFSFGPVAVGARAFRHRGRRHVTVFVKLTCTMRHDSPMFVAPPRPIVLGDKPRDGRPGASLVRGSDAALMLPQPEVLVVGSAFAAPGQRIEATSVRLAVQRDGAMLIHKRLDVVGDRRVHPGAAEPAPTPFDRMPIVYERAFGGRGDSDNPVGTGRQPEPDGSFVLPNVFHPSGQEQPGAGPAGFGPIAGAWPRRASRLGGASPDLLDVADDVELPIAFDPTFFQSAPADQRVPELRPGDQILLVNMHPEQGTLRASLPDGVAVAIAQTAAGAKLLVPTRLDLVHIEPDASRAEIVFRGTIEIEERDLPGLRVGAGLERPGRTSLSFPDLSTLPAPKRAADAPLGELHSTALIAPPAGAQPPRPSQPGLGGTQLIDGPSLPAAAAPAASRFASTMLVAEGAQPTAAVPFVSGAPAPPPPAPPPPAPPAPLHAASHDEDEPPATQAVPENLIIASAPFGARGPSAEAARRAGTLEIEPGNTPRSLPFGHGRPSEPREPAAPVPGAPWAGGALPPVLPGNPLQSTVLVDAPAPRPPPPVAVPPPPVDVEPPAPPADLAEPAPPPPPLAAPAPPPPAPPPQEAKSDPKKSVWREEPEAPAPAPPPKPAAPPPAPRADLRQDLYKKFKR